MVGAHLKEHFEIVDPRRVHVVGHQEGLQTLLDRLLAVKSCGLGFRGV